MVRDQCDSPLRGASAPRGPSSTLLDRHQHSGRKRAAAANVASGALRATDGKPHEHPSAAAALGTPHEHPSAAAALGTPHEHPSAAAALGTPHEHPSAAAALGTPHGR